MSTFNDFDDILEYIPISNSVKNNLIRIYQSQNINKLDEYKLFIKYLDKYCNPNTTQTYIISLSGGIDSMLITCFLKHYLPSSHKIIGAHINYHQRGNESNREEMFLEKWCKDNNIIWEKTEVVGYNRRDSCQRQNFETEGTEIRYGFYQELLKKYPLSKGVFLGHHHDDRAENIYTNIMHGRSILDLSVLKPISYIRSVPIMRPLLGIYKPSIFKIGNILNIPYFKDTTPDWSNRGILRRQIFPLFEKQYGQIFRQNLNRIGDQSDFIMHLIQKTILDNIYKNIFYFGKDGFIIPFSDIDPQYHNTLIWGMIWEKACHTIGIGRLGNKKLENFVILLINGTKNQFIEINSGFKCFIDFENKNITLFNKEKYPNKKDFMKAVKSI